MLLRARVTPVRVLAPLLGLLLLAFGLRVAGLETQSIWVDEGFSVDFSSRTATCMTDMWRARGGAGTVSDAQTPCAANDPLAIAVDIHPPLYYLLLHEWMPLAGRGEYAVRFPSVLVGVLLVLLLYKLGASLAGPGLGLAAAGVGAVAPFYVAYSQEARMYAPVALFAGFSLYFTWLVLRRRRGRWAWLGLVVSSSLALYTHYSAVLVIGAENLLVLGWLLFARRERRLLLGWAGSQLLELLLFLPWLRTTIGQVARYNENLWVPNWRLELTETFRAFDAGLWVPDRQSLQLAAALTVLLLAGLGALLLRPTSDPQAARGAPSGRLGEIGGSDTRLPDARASKRSDHGRALSVFGWSGTWLAAGAASNRRHAERRLARPLMLLAFGGGALLAETALALIAFQIRPEFHPRYLMVLATPYYLLLGAALFGLWRWQKPAGALASVGLLAAFAFGLRGYEFDPNFAKDDTRGLAAYLSANTTADDVIIADAPEPLGYYYHGPAALDWIPGDEATVAGALNQKVAGKKRVVYVQWYLSTSDPEQLLPFLLQKYGTLVGDKTFRGYRERTYAIPPNTDFELTATSQPVNANFDGILQLEGAGLTPSAVSGRQVLLALDWKLLAPVNKDYKASAYLTDAAGHLGGQADLLLRDGQATSKRWPAGEESANYYVIDTIPGLMPGRYTVNVAVYGDGEQERLSVFDAAGAPGGGNVAVGSVDILPPDNPPDRGALNAARSVDDPVAPGVRLIGYDMPGQTVVQGDPLHLTLFWQASAKPPDGLQTTIALEPSAQSAAPWRWSEGPSFPTGQWQAGDIFRDWYDPVLPAQLPPGPYQLLVGMGADLVPVGQVQVQERTRTFDAPTPQHPVGADLGGSIEMLGYDTDKPSYAPGSTAHVTLYWRAKAQMADSYTAFVHLLDGGRHVVAQMDAVPQHGQMPTTAWLPGEVVADTYELALKPDLAPGTYQLEAGFYRGDTGVRLKASSTDVQAIDDGLLIGTLAVSR